MVLAGDEVRVEGAGTATINAGLPVKFALVSAVQTVPPIGGPPPPWWVQDKKKSAYVSPTVGPGVGGVPTTVELPPQPVDPADGPLVVPAELPAKNELYEGFVVTWVGFPDADGEVEEWLTVGDPWYRHMLLDLRLTFPPGGGHGSEPEDELESP